MTVKENLEKVREGLEKAAYTAVGAPVAGVKALKERTDNLSQAVSDKRKDLKSDVEREFKDWVAEGEAIIDRVVDWVRSTDTPTELRSARHGAAEQARSAVTGIASKLDEILDFVESDIELTEIKGVGPATAATLESAGVPGISSLLDRTATETGLKQLADETGIAADSLADWRAQVDLTAIDGVGDSYQRELHAIGIGTMTQLANADAGTIVDRMSGLDRPGLPSQDPSKATVSKWIQKARRLSLEDRK
ncbi:MAG: DUF4332 domain-containing protein [Acidimicrobiia bacterium]